MNIQNDSNGLQSIDFKKIWKEAVLNLGHSTIIVTGKTGVGKSTLINAVFSKDVAETGVGKPITNEIKEYSLENFPISIIDTIGFEAKRFEEIKNKLFDEITRRRNDPDPTKHVNVCWYCIAYGVPRIELAEIEFLKELSKFVKIIVVLTQYYDINDGSFYSKVVEALYSTDIKVIKLVAQTKYSIPAYGLDK
ncbi:MAG: 50S ribosome-binding GTPase, partial [Bacteroidales bacterium]|nr:50S ribosome-binding GTPase [Bacteroidales bacterium]